MMSGDGDGAHVEVRTLKEKWADLLKGVDAATLDLEARGLLERHPENAEVYRLTRAGESAATEVVTNMPLGEFLLVLQTCLDKAPGAGCSLTEVVDDVLAEISDFSFEATIDTLASEDRQVLDRLLDAAIQMAGGDLKKLEDRMAVRAGFVVGYAVGRLVELWEPAEERDESCERQAG